MAKIESDESLANRGLKRVTKYACVFYDETDGWEIMLSHDEENAIQCRGYGDFAGCSEVVCVIPETGE